REPATPDGGHHVDARLLAKLYGGARVVIGAALLLAPTQTARGWIGDDAEAPGTRVALRALGARDLVLGAGLLEALGRDKPVVRWLEAGMASDLTDAVVSATGEGERTSLAIAMAASGVALGAYVRSQLDPG
ncbi:MAG: hypothetical protein R3320_03320, partial [Nitriliruptorales bacterium]|nr:hypothetical protein [Nitriliruptorales bacterium]